MDKLKKYGVYVNPFPGNYFSPARIKTEARHAGLAWWVYADDGDEAWGLLVSECADQGARDFLQSRFDAGLVLIDPVTDEEIELNI